jgi:hypothetical protein
VLAGQTISGDAALSFRAGAADTWGGVAVAFPFTLPAAPLAVLLSGQSGCTAPGVAPAGIVCLYAARSSNVTSIITTADDAYATTPAPFSADRHGFYLQITAGNAGITLWQGTWSYTLP